MWKYKDQFWINGWNGGRIIEVNEIRNKESERNLKEERERESERNVQEERERERKKFYNFNTS